jgi:two-component system, chemotaxis family, protein-glutamate methylesterase/glutaminase
MAGRVRVLVVDDSAFARKVLRETLSAHAEIEVVGIARDGLEALECIERLSPDVMTLDLVMPNLDGLGVLRSLPRRGAPRVVVVSIAGDESELGVAALQAGAVALVHKPTALATDRLFEISDELTAKVLAAASARPSLPLIAPARVEVHSQPKSKRILLIGASAGGPQALTYLLKALPADFPVPIAVVVHMPSGYTDTFARRLNDECDLKVIEASEGTTLRPGLVVMARAGIHLRVLRQSEALRAQLSVEPIGQPHTPSVDALFTSMATQDARDVLAVVLTGMGDDGLVGARALVGAGATVLTEAKSSCVVYGMPRAIKEAGLSGGEAPLERMAETIIRHL